MKMNFKKRKFKIKWYEIVGLILLIYLIFNNDLAAILEFLHSIK